MNASDLNMMGANISNLYFFLLILLVLHYKCTVSHWKQCPLMSHR